MGKGKRADAIEDAASRVAANLQEIRDSLEVVVDRLKVVHQSERAQLRDIIDRVDRCQRLLAAELDRPDPDGTFLRRALAISVTAAKLAGTFAGGLATSEIAERYDLRSPLEQIEAAASASGEEDDDPPENAHPASAPVQWRVTAQEGEWTRLASDPAVRAFIDVKQRRDAAGRLVTVSISFGRSYDSSVATVVLEGRVASDVDLAEKELADLVHGALEEIAGRGGVQARGLVTSRGRRQSFSRANVVVDFTD